MIRSVNVKSIKIKPWLKVQKNMVKKYKKNKLSVKRELFITMSQFKMNHHNLLIKVLLSISSSDNSYF